MFVDTYTYAHFAGGCFLAVDILRICVSPSNDVDLLFFNADAYRYQTNVCGFGAQQRTPPQLATTTGAAAATSPLAGACRIPVSGDAVEPQDEPAAGHTRRQKHPHPARVGTFAQIPRIPSKASVPSGTYLFWT